MKDVVVPKRFFKNLMIKQFFICQMAISVFAFWDPAAWAQYETSAPLVSEYQEIADQGLLAFGPSLDLPDIPAPPVPPRPPKPSKPHNPRYDRVFRQGPSLFGGWSTGGDSINTPGGSQLNAGDGTSFHFGWNMDFKTGVSRTALEWAIGYRWNEVDFKDSLGRSGTAKMNVITLDSLAYFQQSIFRIGGGLTYHLLPSYSEEIKDTFFSTNNSVDFKNQWGLMAAIEFAGVRTPFFVNFRYTYIVYKPKGGSYIDSQTNERITEVNGSNFGIYAGLHFR